MLLGFRTNWPKKMDALADEPTYFVEQIWKAFQEQPITAEFKNALHSGNFNMKAYNEASEKLHTIREDSRNRWKVGNKIHFYISVRQKNMLKFAPVKEVIAIQEIEIRYTDPDGLKLPEPNVYIDGSWFFDYDTLAKNDGFPSVEAFFRWFDKDFKGKIIHWTDLKY